MPSPPQNLAMHLSAVNGPVEVRQRRIARGSMAATRYGWTQDECAALPPPACDRRDHGAARLGAPRRHLLRHPGGLERGGDSGAHALQHRLGGFLWPLRVGRSHARRHRRANHCQRMGGGQRWQARPPDVGLWPDLGGAGPQSHGGGPSAMKSHTTAHRKSGLWIAAMVHRLSGLALACFLPLHFLALGLAINGEAPLDRFLEWTANPLVKLAETILVFLLTVHLLGGVRVLLIETLPWREGHKQLATAAVAAAALAAIAFLVRAA